MSSEVRNASKDRITRRVTKTDGIRYDVRLRIDGKPTIKTFRRRHDADAYLRQRLVDDLRGVALDPKRAAMTFEAYSATWLANGGTRGHLALRTHAYYADLRRRYVFLGFGSR